MKRSITKIITSMFLILTLAFLISFTNANAMTSSTGDGTESNPYKLTIGYCVNDAFAYNRNGNTYLDVTFTQPAEVSCSFAQTGPWVMVKTGDTTYTNWKSLSGGTFYVKGGMTVSILIKSGSSSTPIQFTSKVLSDTSLYCKENAIGKHHYSASHGPKCDYGCGHTCTHPEADRAYYDDYVQLEVGKHAQMFECKTCEQKAYDVSKATACTLSAWTADNNHDYHRAECILCDRSYQENCTFTKKTYVHYRWDTHFEYPTCSVCGNTSNAKAKNHKFKSNKCTQCGFKRIVPGNSKVTYMKQSGKMKRKKYTRNGYLDKFLEWHPNRTTITYNYTIKVKFKKAKNAVKYVVSPSKNPDSAIYTIGKNKTSATFTYSDSKKKSKVTLYFIPVSKTGTPGTAIKKVIKLKN